jgi:mannose-6-phosphate isomerase-like protein (cupin superfamily)
MTGGFTFQSRELEVHMSGESPYTIIRSGDQERSPRGTIALEGKPYGSDVSLFIIDYSQPGEGPNLHKHPYPETWIVRDGSARFTVNDQTLEAGPGDVVVCAAETPHKFKNVGPGNLDIICIHPSPQFIQVDWE